MNTIKIETNVKGDQLHSQAYMYTCKDSPEVLFSVGRGVDTV